MWYLFVPLLCQKVFMQDNSSFIQGIVTPPSGDPVLVFQIYELTNQ